MGPVLERSIDARLGAWYNLATVKHGHTKKGGQRSPEYITWASMIQRCADPNSTGYRNYGGRGIKVCKRWKSDFRNFFADMGRRPSSSHSIDRIDNDGNYEPGNCRWATPGEQARNRRVNRMVDGLCVTDASGKQNLNVSTVINRLNRGWSPKRALTQAPKPLEDHPITIDGVTRSLGERARDSGLSYSTALSRLKSGWEPTEIFQVVPGAKGVGRKPRLKLTLDGVTKTIGEWAREKSIKRTTIEMRLKNGWTVERALGTPTVPKRPREAVRLTVDGVSKTFFEWASETGISPSTIRARIARGMLPADAVRLTRLSPGPRRASAVKKL